MMRRIATTFFLFFLSITLQAFLLEGSIQVLEKKTSALFEFVGETESDLRIRIYPQGSSSFCLFTVKRFVFPNPRVGQRGIIFSNREKDCYYKLESKEETSFWNEVSLLDFDYSLSREKTFVGRVKLSSLKESLFGDLIFKANGP